LRGRERGRERERERESRKGIMKEKSRHALDGYFLQVVHCLEAQVPFQAECWMVLPSSVQVPARGLYAIIDHSL
jgi:hypothetical protein